MLFKEHSCWGPGLWLWSLLTARLSLSPVWQRAWIWLRERRDRPSRGSTLRSCGGLFSSQSLLLAASCTHHADPASCPLQCPRAASPDFQVPGTDFTEDSFSIDWWWADGLGMIQVHSICRVLYFKSNAAAGLTGGNPVHGVTLTNTCHEQGLEVGDPWLENPHCLLWQLHLFSSYLRTLFPLVRTSLEGKTHAYFTWISPPFTTIESR